MLRSLSTFALLMLINVLAAQNACAQDIEAVGRDPFLIEYGSEGVVVEGVEQIGYESPAGRDDGRVFPAWPGPRPASPGPADSAGSARSGIDHNSGGRVTIGTSHPNLFPNEAVVRGPLTDEDRTYPDGTIPIQYPLDDDAYRGLPEAYPGYSPGPVYSPHEIAPTAPAGHPGPAGWKSRTASLTHVFGGALSVATLDVRGTLEFPSAPGLFVTPQFGLHLLSGPSTTDLPARLYDASLNFSLYRPVGDAWLLNVSIAPSLFTDGDNVSSDALRIIGRFMAYYTVSPQLQLAGGIIYLDREDVRALPAAGVIYTPSDAVRYELLFPKPRIAWRQYFTPAYEQWVYVTGELGGGSWAVQRTTGADDIASYRDLRLVLGVERKMTDGRKCYAEFGYVFGREVEYQSNLGNLSLSDTGFLRIGSSF